MKIPVKLITKGTLALVEAVGVKGLVELGGSLSQKTMDTLDKRAEEKAKLVEIPEIYSKDYHLKLEDAQRLLEEDGLRVESVIAKPNPRFKDLSDFDVVYSKPTPKQKVMPDTRIFLRYVTKEVIEASQKLFDEAEQQKAEKKLAKQYKKDQNKQKVDEKLHQIKNGLGNAASMPKKNIEGIITNLRKKD